MYFLLKSGDIPAIAMLGHQWVYIRGLVTLNHCPSSTKRAWGVFFISFLAHLQEDGVILMP